MKNFLFIITLLTLASCKHYVITHKPSETLLISHKGIWKTGQFPANTIKAFDEALKQGFDGFELDVVLTLDNEFLVIHDDKLSNTTNCDGFVSKSSSDELKYCSSKKNSVLPVTALIIQRTKNRDGVSFLSEIFTRYLPQERLKKIIIDIKSDKTQETIIALKKALPVKLTKASANKIIFIGKSTEMLKKIKQNFPHSSTALEGEWGSEPVIDYPKYLHNKSHDYVSLNAELMFGHTKIKKNFYGRKRRNKKYLDNYFSNAKQSKMKTIAWVINDKKNYQYLLSKDVEIILTDLNLSLKNN